MSFRRAEHRWLYQGARLCRPVAFGLPEAATAGKGLGALARGSYGRSQ